MPVDVQTVLATAVLPLVSAVGVAWLIGWVVPAETAKRYSLGLAGAAGFIAGYVVLPGAELVPVKIWHWLPYLAVAAVLGATTLGAKWPMRLVAFGLLALAAAWLLVPDWEDLQPPRYVLLPLLAGYLILLSALLTALPNRLIGPQFVGLLTASAGTTALLIAIGYSFKQGQLAAIAAAALGGAWLAMPLMKLTRRASEEPSDWLVTSTRGLIPVFAILVGGLAFLGAIEPEPPMPLMLVAPVAPLLLWLFAAGPLSRLQGFTALAAQTAAVMLPLVIALAIIAWEIVSEMAEAATAP